MRSYQCDEEEIIIGLDWNLSQLPGPESRAHCEGDYDYADDCEGIEPRAAELGRVSLLIIDLPLLCWGEFCCHGLVLPDIDGSARIWRLMLDETSKNKKGAQSPLNKNAKA